MCYSSLNKYTDCHHYSNIHTVQHIVVEYTPKTVLIIKVYIVECRVSNFRPYDLQFELATVHEFRLERLEFAFIMYDISMCKKHSHSLKPNQNSRL